MPPQQWKNQSGSRSRTVVEVLTAGIQQGTFAPGQRLPSQEQMCATFGVSRTVIREAVKVLEGRGLVHSRPRSGVFVIATTLGGASPEDGGGRAGEVEISLREVVHAARQMWYFAVDQLARTGSPQTLAELESTTARALARLRSGDTDVSERFLYESTFGLKLTQSCGNAFVHMVMVELFRVTGAIDLVVVADATRHREIVETDARIVESMQEHNTERTRFYGQERDRLIQAVVGEQEDLLDRTVRANVVIR